MYSLFNEEPIQGTLEGANIFHRMRSRVLKLDDSRLITGAMNGGQDSSVGAAPYMDVTGVNYNVPAGVDSYHKLYPNHPVVGSENNSAISTRGCYKTDKDAHVLSCYDEEVVPWGQLIKTTWKFTREHDWFGGIFIWTGFDYRGEPTPYDWPSIGSQFGIMDTCGFAKDSFYQNKACFTTVPMVHILPHWEHKPGDIVRVMTASNCEEVELFLNGSSLGIKKSDCCEPCEWQVEFVPGKLSAVGYNGGIAVASAENITAGSPKRIVLEPDRSSIMNDGMDTVAINLSVVDENGITVETASNLIELEMLGEVTLLGVGNGDPNCLESDHEPRRSLFAGHAQALVQSRVGAKRVAVRAFGEGLEDALLELEVIKAPSPHYIYAAQNRSLNGFTVSADTFETEPDALIEIADNDMNSFEPLGFDQWSVRPGFSSGWKLLRNIFSVPSTQNPDAKGICEITFKTLVADELKLWIDGKLIYEGKPEVGKPLSVSWKPDGSTDKSELRAALKARNGEASGIQNGVSIKAL